MSVAMDTEAENISMMNYEEYVFFLFDTQEGTEA